MQQWDKALEGFREALQLVVRLGDKRQLPIVQQNIANCLGHLGRTQEAEAMLDTLIDAAQKNHELPLLANAYRLMADAHERSGNYRQALEDHRQYKQYSDTLHSNQTEKTIHELEIRYETSSKEAHIAQLEAARKLDAAKKALYLALLLICLLSGAWLVLFLRRRERRNRAALQRVRQELDSNMQELLRFTDNIIHKNQQIAALEQQLQQQARDAARVQREEADREQLSGLYQLKILTEEDWRNFKILFDKVYPGFISQLRARFPDLAPAEERQSLLIRLNIDNKECADMLGISAESVKKNRYRLKKRFQLGDQESLDDFVRYFPAQA